MIYAIQEPMPDTPMHHYLLSPYEAELLAIFRGLSASGKDLIANVIAQQAGLRYVPIQYVELSIVKKGA